MPAKLEIPNLDNLLRRYVAGESENKLAREAGINRWTFRRRILKAGIIPRNGSSSMLLRWQNSAPEERAALIAPAHAAARGSKRTVVQLHTKALGTQRTLANTSPVEYALADALTARGYAVTQQLAVGPYNIDVTVDGVPVAVEVFGGYWHGYGHHAWRFFERSKYLLDSGWHLLVVWVEGRNYPLDASGIEYVISFLEEVRRNPPFPCEYRVILGNGQFAPIHKRYLNSPADIERLRSG